MSNPTEPSTKYFKVSHEIYETKWFKKLPIRAKALYPILCKLRNRIGNKEGLFPISIETIHKKFGISENTIYEATKDLIKIGVLYCEKGPRERAKYKIRK